MKPLWVLLILGLAIGGFFGWRHWNTKRRAEQAEVCWRFYGSTDVLNDQAQQCLVFKYGWSKDAAFLEQVHRQADAWKQESLKVERRKRPVVGILDPSHHLTADSLWRFYQTKPDKEHDLFRRKVLEVTGEVLRIVQENDGVTPTVYLRTPGAPVLAYLRENYIATRDSGSMVRMVCAGYGASIDKPILTDCTFR